MSSKDENPTLYQSSYNAEERRWLFPFFFVVTACACYFQVYMSIIVTHTAVKYFKRHYLQTLII